MRVTYTPEQRRIAVQTYRKTKSVAKTINILGYPSTHILYDWIKGVHRGRPPKERHHSPVHYPWTIKRRAVDMVLEGRSVQETANALGIYCEQQIYKWVRIWRQNGDRGLMSKAERGELKPHITKKQFMDSLPEDHEELKELAARLLVEKAVLEREIELSKKNGASSRDNCQ